MNLSVNTLNKSPFARGLVWLVGILSILGALSVVVHRQYNPLDHTLPTGCDEFGYLNMAKAIDSGDTFSDHAERPFLKELLVDLRAQFPDPNHYRWLIAPHAYHVADSGDRIVNQYPPGVGLILAPFPIEKRRVAFPIISFLIGAIALVLACYIDANGKLSLWPFALLPAIALLVTFSDTAELEFRRVDSLAPTYGLLIATGLLLPRHPAWSLFLLSLTVIFRLPNALLFVPVGLACLFLSEPRPAGFAMRISGFAKLAAATLFSGFGLYLIYAYLRLGNPFGITYSSLDQEFAKQERFLKNLDFYFVTHPQWLWPHLFSILTLILAVWFRPAQRKWLAFGVALWAFNYLFYLTHHVQIDYYPYATALICLGLALGCVDLENVRPLLVKAIAGVGVAATVAIAFQTRPASGNTKEDFDNKVEPLQAAFGAFDVIWAEHRSGTIEYATDRSGFRYNWGPDPVRHYTMRWLRERGYRQAIWVSDIGMPERETIARKLTEADIPFDSVENSETGAYFIIRTNNG